MANYINKKWYFNKVSFELLVAKEIEHPYFQVQTSLGVAVEELIARLDFSGKNSFVSKQWEFELGYTEASSAYNSQE